MPLKPFMALTSQQYVSQVNLRATDPARVEDVRIAVRDLLEQRHGVRDVQVISLARLLDRVNEALSVITGFLAALAGISLLVGGIGIMNIMLAVVAERTREIGIIRALGATRAAVVGQFLAEAVLISVIGGTVGLLLALGAAAVIERAMGVPALVSVSIVALAIGVSSLVGVVFGVLPAYRAARLDPIRAGKQRQRRPELEGVDRAQHGLGRPPVRRPWEQRVDTREQAGAQHRVREVGARLVERRDRVEARRLAAAQPRELREDEPHPVR